MEYTKAVLKKGQMKCSKRKVSELISRIYLLRVTMSMYIIVTLVDSNLLELRQYKNGFVSVKRMFVLKCMYVVVYFLINIIYIVIMLFHVNL